jgi:hypothetical protein
LLDDDTIISNHDLPTLGLESEIALPHAKDNKLRHYDINTLNSPRNSSSSRSVADESHCESLKNDKLATTTFDLSLLERGSPKLDRDHEKQSVRDAISYSDTHASTSQEDSNHKRHTSESGGSSGRRKSVSSHKEGKERLSSMTQSLSLSSIDRPISSSAKPLRDRAASDFITVKPKEPEREQKERDRTKKVMSGKDVPVVTYEGRKKLLALMVGGQVYKLNLLPLVQLDSFYNRPTTTGEYS